MALPARFTSVWRSLPGSPFTSHGMAGSNMQVISIPLSWALEASISTVSSNAVRRSKGISSRVSLPASIFEKSSISLISSRRFSPLLRTVSAYCRCSGSRSVSSSRPVMPITPFIGVRISWLMVARNSLLALVASSALSRASASSAFLVFNCRRDLSEISSTTIIRTVTSEGSRTVEKTELRQFLASTSMAKTAAGVEAPFSFTATKALTHVPHLSVYGPSTRGLTVLKVSLRPLEASVYSWPGGE